MTLAPHHLAVVVADLGRAERFYVDVLGLEVLRRLDDDHGEPRAVWLALGGGAFLAIERARRDGPRRDEQAPGWHCLALGIDKAERQGWRERLARAGYPVERETSFTLYVRDPDGCLLGLSHYPE